MPASESSRLDIERKAKNLDAMNGNTLWADAISKEIENVTMAFEI